PQRHAQMKGVVKGAAKIVDPHPAGALASNTAGPCFVCSLIGQSILSFGKIRKVRRIPHIVPGSTDRRPVPEKTHAKAPDRAPADSEFAGSRTASVNQQGTLRRSRRPE